jgi:hypothetical protein
MPEGLRSLWQDGLRLCQFYIRRLDDPRAIPSKEEEEVLESSWYSHTLNDFED